MKKYRIKKIVRKNGEIKFLPQRLSGWWFIGLLFEGTRYTEFWDENREMSVIVAKDTLEEAKQYLDDHIKKLDAIDGMRVIKEEKIGYP